MGGRIAQAALVALLASAAIFGLVRQIPGDPAVVLAGTSATPATLAAIRHDLALDQPVPVQYVQWMRALVQGDLGMSISTRQPVSRSLTSAFKPTVQLALAAVAITIVLGLALGILGAVFRNTWIDAIVTAFASVSLGVPAFWLGSMLLYLFALKLPWFPPGGWVDVLDDPVAGLQSLALPALVVGIVQAAILSRFVRSGLIEALLQDHVRTARSKGLPEWLIIWRYGLRNALIPVVTVLGLVLGNLLAGVVIVEIVFSWPGLGSLLISAVGERDYPVIQGALLLLIAIFTVVNLVVDLLYISLDPRTRR